MQTTVRNAEYTKKYNRNLVIKLLMAEPMFRSELARKTGLTRATISNIVDELIAEGLVLEEKGTVQKKGRTPVPLILNETGLYAVGVYMSRASFSVGLVNIKGEIISIKELSPDFAKTTGEMLTLIAAIINELVIKSKIERKKILGVGISSPGPVDHSNGTILNPPSFENWHNTDVVTPINNLTGMNTILENTAYSIATYELTYGNARNISSFVLLLIDSGVGCGIVSNGKLYKGAHALSGEIGHSSINYWGERCSCGNYGCLELYASIPNLLKRFGLPAAAWKNVVSKARNNDPDAIRILNQECEYLVAGIINTVNMLDVEAVILEGDIMDAFDIISPFLEKQINEKIITRSFGKMRILPSCSHKNHQISTAANIVFNNYFNI